jgi:hypothetical protein
MVTQPLRGVWLAVLRAAYASASRALSDVHAGLGLGRDAIGAGQRAQAFGRPLALPWGRTLPAVSVLAVAPIVTTANLLQGSLSICLSTF